ncbi:MAG: cupin domain-containing protein [Planctomycetota bacterium]
MQREQRAMHSEPIDACHGGVGRLLCRVVMEEGESDVGIRFMHDDVLEPGASIGEHLHADDEEIYFVVEGSGTMILDGAQRPIGPGDVSLVKRGHTHGIVNSQDGPMRLIVVCVEPSGTG